MLTLRVDGSEHVIKAFDRIQDGRSRRDLMDQIGSYGLSSTQQRFLDQAGPDGHRWKPSYRAKTEGGQTLRDEGQLFASLTYDHDEKSASWGSNKIYAGIHQLGGTIKSKSGGKLAFRLSSGKLVLVDKVEMPARPFLGVDAGDEREIQDIANDWLQECLQ